MSMVVDENLTPLQHRQINACHIFLHSISSFDITTFDGRRITEVDYDGLGDPITMKIRWPNKQIPSTAWWDSWRNFLLIFSDANRFLLQQLRKWIKHKECIHPCKLYSTDNRNTLLEWTGSQWFQHQKQDRGYTNFSKDRQRLDHTPSFKTHEFISVHRSSIEKK
jgi:hypothetical protein